MERGRLIENPGKKKGMGGVNRATGCPGKASLLCKSVKAEGRKKYCEKGKRKAI